MSTIVNCTPHSIDLMEEVDDEWVNRLTIPSSGLLVRVATDVENVGSVTCDEQEFDVRKRVFGDVTVTDIDGNDVGLPVKDDTFYVVSLIVAQALPEREDLLLVDGTIRDDGGRIIGCTGFAVLQ
tara:strand:- start:260 stop:634 length:375 start_codon:yes stop_codon:yes gene_type:complete